MPSTPPAYPQVIWRNLASFRVLKSCIFAVQRDFCAWFDSRQLHENPRQNYKWIGHPLPVKIPVKIWGVAAGPSHRSGPAPAWMAAAIRLCCTSTTANKRAAASTTIPRLCASRMYATDLDRAQDVEDPLEMVGDVVDESN